MFEINVDTAEQYLRERSVVLPGERIRIQRLTGGISNEVLLVERTGEAAETIAPRRKRRAGAFVLKQARAQLRTEQPWFASVERNWREVAVQRRCAALARGQVPRILFADRENYAFAMAAVPAGHRVWRDELLAGRIDPALGAASGRLLATLHAGTWGGIKVSKALYDRTLFYELRVAPYYEAVARDVPEVRGWMRNLIASLAAPPRALVHADFSPKNLLLFDGTLTLVDFETGHLGDPAFDIGFFLAHLVLKTIYHGSCANDLATVRAAQMLELIQQFWDAYLPIMVERIGGHPSRELAYRGLQHLAGCLWARLDGTSRVDYLNDPMVRERVRDLCRVIFTQGPTSWEQTVAMIQARLN